MISSKSSIGDDSWTNIEHMIMSAIKLGKESWVGYGMSTLRKKFPESSRVKKLSGLFKESNEDWVEAESIYKEMLLDNPHDLYPRKRLIACLKAQGRFVDTIGAILDQLEVFSSDIELWHELSMIYMNQCAFSKAVVSFEEVLLSNPTSFYNLLVYAELLGSSGRWDLARKYYCKALQYRPNELRALWGILNSLISNPGDDKAVHSALVNECKRRLVSIYSAASGKITSKLALSIINRIE
jgi:tetratricopeptide (TPR) repeat protein